MSLSTRLTTAFGRVGTEIKSIRTQLNLTDQYAKRWEQEILSQSETRKVGFGPVPHGLYVPYNVQLKGVHYKLGSSTTSGATKATLYELSASFSLTDLGFSMNIPANADKQTVTNTAVNVNAGSRLVIEITDVGSGTIGTGLYVSLWGVYR